MKTTYDEILANMKSDFQSKTGEDVELMGDLGARFQAVASELYSVSCYADYVLKQAFVQTATGDYLDYHGEMRNMSRKHASKAKGVLTFGVNEPAESNIVVEKGTVCSASDNPYLQFSINSEAVITAGSSYVDVEATALENGSDYNVKPNKITVMVNPPSSVAYVINASAFSGGNDEESDEALRKRIVASYNLIPTGVSAQSIREVILNIDNVLDCSIISSENGDIEAVVKTQEAYLTSDTEEEILNALMISKLANVDTTVTFADEASFNLAIEANVSTYDVDSVKEQIEKAVKNYTDGLKIGESLVLSRIASIISVIDGINYCDIGSSSAYGGTVLCDARAFLKLDNLVVNCYE